MKKTVLEHYENIADDFTGLSNKYCNERYRLEISKYAKDDKSILDIGCGTGLLLSQVKARKRVGVDVSPRLLGQLRNNSLHLIQSDAETLPFKQGSFDLVYSVNLLEHVPHPGTVVNEGVGVLKRGGKLVLITPNGDLTLFLEIADRLKLKAPEGPHRFLTTKEIMDIIPKNTVKIIKYERLVLFPKGPRFVLGALERLEPIVRLGFFHLVVLEKTK